MYDYHATVIRLVGPLTLLMHIDLGFNVYHETNIRLDGIAQPERSNRMLVRRFINDWLDNHHNFTVRTHKTEKYGRWLGTVTGEDESSLNAELLTTALVESINNAKIIDDEMDMESD